MPVDDSPIDQLLENYTSAVAAKDAACFMRLYAPDVRVFDLWDSWTYEGAAAWHAAVRAWFDSLGDNSVRVTFDSRQSFGGPQLFMVSAIVTYTGLTPGAEILHSMQNRLTWAVRILDAGPQIIHEHTSAPIRSGEMKAILRL